MADEMIQKIREYKPFNEQEERDREVLLRLLSGVEDVYSRENLTAHMTASAWVVNANRDKVLMAYHNIYHSWSWLGGHADGERDLLAVALREVGEESGCLLYTSIKLLRVLQEREIMRVGGNQIIHVDVRIIAATNESLEKKVEEGSFRRDLYYRINTLPALIPPLRERGNAIFLLLARFAGYPGLLYTSSRSRYSATSTLAYC